MIVIVDYGMGNTASILNMIQRAGGEAIVSPSLKDINTATKLILPGVGAFDNAICKLQQSGIAKALEHRLRQDRIPFLGICLGMQLLFNSSEEGSLPGLGLLSGSVRRFAGSAFEAGKLKIPHMGWNIVHPVPRCTIFEGLQPNPRFYFVHSYHVVCDSDNTVAATCTYGFPFTCAVCQDNIWAVQFHPEKSHKFGMQIFGNFLNQVC